MDEAVKNFCINCDDRDVCRTPCKVVSDILWANNRVMERHYGDLIVYYPLHREVPFSELEARQVDQFSTDDVVPWNTDDMRLTQTKVFVERFFNKIPCKDLAERFGVKDNTVVCMYKQALKQVYKLLKVLDARKEGIKAMKPERFTEDQKVFLLACVFGYTQAELARMLNIPRGVINVRVKRLADKYRALFSGIHDNEEVPIEDPPIKAKMTRADLMRTVETYVEQGLSHRQAFKRIAERHSEVINRPVNYRGVESRYYKTLAACGA